MFAKRRIINAAGLITNTPNNSIGIKIIFTNLTAVFIGQAFEGGHDDADGHHEAVII